MNVEISNFLKMTDNSTLYINIDMQHFLSLFRTNTQKHTHTIMLYLTIHSLNRQMNSENSEIQFSENNRQTLILYISIDKMLIFLIFVTNNLFKDFFLF